MTLQLESELRAALRERADQVPAASIARATHFDYHPRTRRLRTPVAIGGFATAAGAAGAVAVVISLSAGASSAFAGWTPRPTAPAPGQLPAAAADCQTHSPVAGLPLKLADTRGPFTFSVYADATSSTACINGPTFTAVSVSSTSAPVTVPAGRILLSSAHETDPGSAAYSFADGRTGDGVSAVTLVLDDGTQVQATVGNGWFVAWWPGAHDVKSADITTPTGVTAQTIPTAPAPPCGPQPCSGGPTGSSGGAGGGRSASSMGFGGGSGQVSASGGISISGGAAGTASNQGGAQSDGGSR